MNRIETLREKVKSLYEAQHEDRGEWAEWMSENHVFLVADRCKELAERFGIDAELAEAAGMLHDIADAVMKRDNPAHDEKSAQLATELLQDCEFSAEEIAIIVHDALEFHACKNGKSPKTPVGEVLATADALVHLQSDFYPYYKAERLKIQSIEAVQQSALEKIERDYNHKIRFPEIKAGATSAYEEAKALFL